MDGSLMHDGFISHAIAMMFVAISILPGVCFGGEICLCPTDNLLLSRFFFYGYKSPTGYYEGIIQYWIDCRIQID